VKYFLFYLVFILSVFSCSKQKKLEGSWARTSDVMNGLDVSWALVDFPITMTFNNDNTYSDISDYSCIYGDYEYLPGDDRLIFSNYVEDINCDNQDLNYDRNNYSSVCLVEEHTKNFLKISLIDSLYIQQSQLSPIPLNTNNTWELEFEKIN
tara:strand:- start:161 stop:616 length:456 start_codon:yes stop_codon:yes gene_type:complete